MVLVATKKAADSQHIHVLRSRTRTYGCDPPAMCSYDLFRQHSILQCKELGSLTPPLIRDRWFVYKYCARFVAILLVLGALESAPAHDVGEF